VYKQKQDNIERDVVLHTTGKINRF